MPTRLRLLPAAVVLSCVSAVSAYAQAPSSAQSAAPAPANLAYVEGNVDVVQDGVTERADPPVMLIEGDVVRTRLGRAEIVFGDGTLLHLGHDSEVEILAPEHLRLLSGRAIVRQSHAAARPYVIDTPVSSVRLESQGEYGITSERTARLEVSVTRGVATINEQSAWTIRSGQVLTLGAGTRPYIQAFNSGRLDAFSQWAYDRVNGFSTARSAPQLPYELRPYGHVLDQHGRWDYITPHGYVWFPSVAAHWRPYYDGSWAFTRYGWTWRGRDRWAWPTHHFGRWGFTGSAWFWIPVAGWGPAWVSWSYAPDYVSWAPLGWDGRPVIGLWTGHYNHPAYAPHFDPWRAWTVIPRRHFAPRHWVRSYAIDGSRLDDSTRRTLVTNTAVPNSPTPEVAVPRDSLVGAGGRGNVRRQQPPASPTPGAYLPSSPGGNRRSNDAPDYAPPASWGGRGGTTSGGGRAETEDRRGGVRAVPRPSERSTGAAEADRRSEPGTEQRRSDPPPSVPADRGGAVERSGDRRAPRAGVPERAPSGGGAASAGGSSAGGNSAGSGGAAAPSHGGARRRPGGQ